MKDKALQIRWLLLACYAVLVFLGVAWHEPWRDEADIWVVMRDITFDDFITFFSYSGHPPLWHMTLLPFARLDMPYITMGLVHACIATGAAYLILMRSPFPLAFSALFIFSVIMAYQFAVVARGYALMNLLLFAVAATYPKRHEKPVLYGAIIALLFNTESFVMWTSMILGLHFLWETLRIPDWRLKKGYRYSFALIALGWLICFVSLWPREDGNQFVTQLHNYDTSFLQRLRYFTIPWAHIQDQLFTSDAFTGLMDRHMVAFALPGIAVLLATAWLLGKSWVQLLHVSWVAWLYFIFTYKYPGGFYHGEMMMPYTVFILWMWYNTRALERAKNMAFRVLVCLLVPILAASAATTPYEYYTEYRRDYSGSKDMANFIVKNGLAHHNLAYVTCYSMTSVMAYLPDTESWMVGQDRHSHYLNWNYLYDACQNMPMKDRLQRVKEQYNDQMLILSELPLENNGVLPLKLLHASKGRLFLEDFYLYQKAPVSSIITH